MDNTLVSKQLSMGVLRLSCLELFLLEQKKIEYTNSIYMLSNKQNYDGHC